MRKKIRAVTGNPLISGSFFIFTGGILANFFNFLFNLVMSRNLAVSDYGTLLSLVSLVTLLSIPASAATPTIVTVAGKLFTTNEELRLKKFYYKILKPFMIIGFLLVLFFLIFSNQIANFLNIYQWQYVVLIAISVLLAYWGTVNIGFLQARLSFKTISVTNVSAAAIKIILGFSFVLLGLGINGALFGYIFSFIVPIVVVIYLLRKQLFLKREGDLKFSYRELASYGIPSSVIVFCLNAYISTDIILVKHLFNPTEAGLYAGLSLIGKVIFYLTSPITTVMFPLIINKFNRGENYKNLLFSSLLIVGGFSLLVTFFYFAFPDFTILFFLKKKEYLIIARNLGHFGILITLYSAVFVLSYYFLSVKQTWIWKILVGGVLLQALLIYFFHFDFTNIINSTIFVLSVLFISLSSIALFKKTN